MKEELSNEQIEYLFSFVRSKYVRYIDLQYELVDHLASAIEEELEKDDLLSFEEALGKVYGNFPITGFSQIVRAKEKEMYYYWLRRMGEWYLQFFKIPQVSILIALTFIFRSVAQFTYGKTIVLALMLMGAVMCYINTFRVISPYRKASEKLLVLYQFNGLYGTFGVMIFVNTNNFLDMQSIDWLGAFGISLISLTMYASSFVFPEWIKKELVQKYGHIDIDKLFKT